MRRGKGWPICSYRECGKYAAVRFGVGIFHCQEHAKETNKRFGLRKLTYEKL